MIPKNGFKLSNVEITEKKSRTYRRASLVLTGLLEELSKAFIIDNQQLFYFMIANVISGNRHYPAAKSPLINNTLAQLYLYGCNEASQICGSILSKSLSLKATNDLISDTVANSPIQPIPQQMTNHHAYIGTRYYTTLKNQCDQLVHGCTFLAIKKKYPYRVKVQQIVSSIQYLQENLPIVSGKTRNVKIDGHTFPRLLAYSLGGQSLNRLFLNYKSLHTESERVGRQNFVTVGRLLCSKGTMKTAASRRSLA